MAHFVTSPQNVGDLYVGSCDCDTCRWMTPEVFNRLEDNRQFIINQLMRRNDCSLQALACPTSSIGTVEKPKDIKDAQLSFPIPVAENVYHRLIRRTPTALWIQDLRGNVLVDSPDGRHPGWRWRMGGIRCMTRDDVADHQSFRVFFGCDRILHADELMLVLRM